VKLKQRSEGRCIKVDGIAMSRKTKTPPDGPTAARQVAVHHQMREQALKVPWQDIAAAVGRLIEHECFALWVRAIANTEYAIPEWLLTSIEHRYPGFGSSHRDPAGHESVWQDLIAWLDDHVFVAARDGGWIEALHYYSGLDPKSEQAWTFWTRSEAEWRDQKPSKYPNFEEWVQEVRREALLEETDTPDKIAALVPQYIEGEAFAYWVRAVVESAHRIPSDVAKSIEQRCPGFLGDQAAHGPSPASTEYASWIWRELLAWIESHTFPETSPSSRLEELRAAARSHLRAERVAAYWAACDSAWVRRPPQSYPGFEEWLSTADSFVVR
jgi:hypothetical protein